VSGVQGLEGFGFFRISGFLKFWNFPLDGICTGAYIEPPSRDGKRPSGCGIVRRDFRKDLSLLPVWAGRVRFVRLAICSPLLFDIVEKEEGEAWSALSLRVSLCGFRVAGGCRRDDAELRFF
jgi:hypothetical protein